MKEFLSLLFNPGEATCLAADIYQTGVYSWEKLCAINEINGRNIPNFFSINPLRGARADANVTSFRNILIEIDKLPLEAQIEHIEKLAMPFSSCVYSGGKSYHFIVSIEQDLSESDWRAYVARIYDVLGRTVVDTSVGNPSRLSRFPGGWRKEKGTWQKLISLRSRITLEALESWLVTHGSFPKSASVKPQIIINPKTEFTSESSLSSISPWTKHFLYLGAVEGERNISLYKAACDFAKCRISEDEAIGRLLVPSGLPEIEAEKTIRKAYLSVAARMEVIA